MTKIWYASGAKRFNEEGESPFYNPLEFTWAIDIENHWHKIKDEIHNLIAETDKQFTSNAYVGLTPEGSWSSYTFLFWKIRVQKKRLGDKCPKLYKYLCDIPGLVSFSLSLLAPQTIVNEHRGDTNAVMRCHFGVEIPAGLPECGLQVGTQQQGWREGKWLFFNDAFKHSAWNKTDKRRIVIIMDVIRPEFLHKSKIICANIRARHNTLHIQNKFKLLKKLGPIFKAPCFAITFIITYFIHNQEI